MCYFVSVRTHACSSSVEPHTIKEEMCIRHCASHARNCESSGDWTSTCGVVEGADYPIAVQHEDYTRVDSARYCIACHLHEFAFGVESDHKADFQAILQNLRPQQVEQHNNFRELEAIGLQMAVRQNAGFGEEDEVLQGLWNRCLILKEERQARQIALDEMGKAAGNVQKNAALGQETRARINAMQALNIEGREDLFFFGNQQSGRQSPERERNKRPPQHFPLDRGVPGDWSFDQKKLMRMFIVPASYFL